MESISESDNKGLREAPPRLELMMLRDLKCQDPSALNYCTSEIFLAAP